MMQKHQLWNKYWLFVVCFNIYLLISKSTYKMQFSIWMQDHWFNKCICSSIFFFSNLIYYMNAEVIQCT